MNKPAVVLDVGNCNPDHAMIRRMLTDNFNVEIDRVMFVDEALQKMRDRRYDLVMFNRLIFDDSSEGLELVRRAKKDASINPAPIMMISNFEEAHTACVAEGGERGFGKNAIGDRGTVERLAKFLPRK